MDALLSHEAMGNDLWMEVNLTNLLKNTDYKGEIANIKLINWDGEGDVEVEGQVYSWGHYSIMLTSIKLLLAIAKILVSV